MLAGEGCDLHLSARNEDALDEQARSLREQHSIDVIAHAADLRVTTDIERLAEAASDAAIPPARSTTSGPSSGGTRGT